MLLFTSIEAVLQQNDISQKNKENWRLYFTIFSEDNIVKI